MDEFRLIESFFINKKNQSFSASKNILLGMGDDAAVIKLDSNLNLVTCVDTLVAGVHFFENQDAADVAFKSLAVNLSDLAAMGARPHSFTLSLTLPEKNETWLKAFSDSLFGLANQYELVLIGGDMSRGPLSVSIQVNGVVDEGKYLRRDAARENDLICVTGYLGLAALGLQEGVMLESFHEAARKRFLRPDVRLGFSNKLFDLGVRCAIDISDGLLSEIAHLCRSSKLSAKLDEERLVLHSELSSLPLEEARALMLSGGDDYELCFSVNEVCFKKVQQWANELKVPISVIGHFQCQSGDALIYDQSDEPVVIDGYKHF